MNRQHAEQWLSQALDGELSPRRQRKLEAYLAAHPELRQRETEWRAIGAQLHAQLPAPAHTSEAAWQDVQRAIRLQQAGKQAVEPSSEAAAGIWLYLRRMGVGAGIVLVALGAWIWLRAPVPGPAATIAEADRTEVEWVETDLPDAMSMVYEDTETGITVIWVMTDEQIEENDHAG